MKSRAILGVAFLALLAATATSQTTRTVPTQYPTIQAAINACVNGDHVAVHVGVYHESIDFLGKALIVYGLAASASSTTIQGPPGVDVVTFASGEGSNSVLTHFTITGGSGIFVHNSSPTIQFCRIVGNLRNGDGGGIRCQSTGAGAASPHFFSCTIENNRTNGAGGSGLAFDCQSSVTSFPTIEKCIVSANSPTISGTQGPGGGVSLLGNCEVAFTKCLIEDNWTANSGGGVFVDGATASFTSCRFLGNHASIGGAIHSVSGNVNLTACLIAGNVAQQFSGAVQLATSSSAPAASLLIKNCTVAGNSAGAGNGGVAVSGTGSPAVTIANTIIWGNTGTNLEAPYASVTTSDVGFGLYAPGAGTISADPRFLDAANGDYHLATASPCRDTGAPGTTGLPTLDLDGGTRIVGASVDMGSDEIPLLSYPGSPEGLDLYVWVDGVGDPLASLRAASMAGDPIRVLMKSSTGSLVGGLPLFAVEIYQNGSPPTPPLGFPNVWLDGGAVVVYGALSAPPFTFPGLAPAGLEFYFAAPLELWGLTVRMQGLVRTPLAVDYYYTSNATEVCFPWTP